MYRYLMRKRRSLRIILSILIGLLVAYYYVSLYRPSLIEIVLEHNQNETSKEITQDFEFPLDNKIEKNKIIGVARTACDLLKSGQPLNTTYIINRDPYDNVIIPKMDCNADVYLVVYVHSSPHLRHRRDTIRRTWGNASQYNLPVRLVFVVGETVGDDRSSKEALKEEIMNYDDIVQSNFIDSYRNLSHKAIAGLKWVTQHCRSAIYVLKTDDDAFVNVYLLLRLIRTGSNQDHYRTNTLACNVRNASRHETTVNRSGKWKATFRECSLKIFPTFCQGIAFLMTRDVAFTLYDASKYVPLFWMDDVYLTGFLPALLSAQRVVLLDAETFFMSTYYINKTTSHQVLAGADAFKFIFYHDDDMKLIETAWNNLKRVVPSQEFSNYSNALLSHEMLLERRRLKNVSCQFWNQNICYNNTIHSNMTMLQTSSNTQRVSNYFIRRPSAIKLKTKKFRGVRYRTPQINT